MLRNKPCWNEVYMYGIVAIALAAYIALFMPGCKGHDGNDGQNAPVPSVEPLDVGSSLCPLGGLALTLNGAMTAICNGATGPQGIPGINAPPIRIVQFCSGTPSYPSVFPEVGFCINGEIYAVYSANDGFLAEIEPGRYESNAIGSSCSFTVLPDCVVTP